MMSKGEDKMTKEETYLALLPQAKALLSGENDLIANMANIAALLDIDSRDFSNFDSIDQLYLEKIMELM